MKIRSAIVGGLLSTSCFGVAKANPPIPFSPQLMAEAPVNANYYPRDATTLTIDNSTVTNGISQVRPEPVFGITGAHGYFFSGMGTAEAVLVPQSPGVADGVQVSTSTVMPTGGIDYQAHYWNRGFYALATFDCAAGSANGGNEILSINGIYNGIQAREPAFVINGTGTNSTGQPSCSIDVQTRNQGGFNDVSVQVPTGLHTHRIIYHISDTGHPSLWVDSGTPVTSSVVAIAPYPNNQNGGNNQTIQGQVGGSQPATLTAWGFFADNDAEFASEEPMLDWWLAQQEASFDPTDAVLPTSQPYYNSTPTILPQNTTLAQNIPATQLADYHGSGNNAVLGTAGIADPIYNGPYQSYTGSAIQTQALGTPQPDITGWTLTFQNTFTYGLSQDVKVDFTNGVIPAANNGYYGSLYDATQSGTPQTNVRLFSFVPDYPNNANASQETISNGCAEPGTDMGDGVTNYLRSSINNPVGSSGEQNWQACSFATTNAIGNGFAQKWGVWEVKFRTGYANCSTSGNTCPGILDVHRCVLWGYLKDGFITHLWRPRIEVDGPEDYNGAVTNHFSGLSLTLLYHNTAGFFPGYGFGLAPYGVNSEWRNNCGDPGQASCIYWCDPNSMAGNPNCSSYDTANIAGEDLYGIGPNQTSVTVGPWHTERIYMNPITNLICHAFDGVLTACTPMTKEFHESPFVAIGGLFPGGNVYDTSGNNYYTDIAWMKVWQNPAWSNIQ